MPGKFSFPLPSFNVILTRGQYSTDLLKQKRIVRYIPTLKDALNGASNKIGTGTQYVKLAYRVT